MEFVLLLILAMTSLFVPVVELIRISVFDQMLAGATHRAARAGASAPGNEDLATCQQAISDAFQERGLARAFLDQDGDGSVDVVFDDSDAEVNVDVAAMGLLDPTPWGVSGCGTGGSFIRVRTTIVVEPWSPLHVFWDGMPRRSDSLARNQTR